MKRFKYLLMFLLVGIMGFSLAACGTDEPDDNGDDNGNGDVETISVWFYNSEDWDTVYAYTDDEDLLGSAPGTEATETDQGEQDQYNWWYVEIEVNVLSNPINITFNDGDGNEAETAFINHPNDVFVAYDGSANQTRRQVRQLFAETVDIYFYNSEDWESVNAYVWTDASTTFGEWPGTGDLEDVGDGWLKVEVPHIPEEEPFNIIFNTSDEDAEIPQTPDTHVSSSALQYMNVKGHITDSQDVTIALNEAETVTRFHLYNEAEWDDIGAYIFGDNEALGGWPGIAAVADPDNEGWYFVDAPVDPDEEEVNVIFNSDNGDGPQTGNIAIPDSDHVFMSTSMDEDADAYPLRGDILPQTVLEFYNAEAWDNVYVDVWNDEGTIDDDISAEPMDDMDDWYALTVPTDFEVDGAFTVQFHDGNGNESDEFVIDDEDHSLIFSVDGVYENHNMAQVWAAHDEDDLVRYYVYNPEGWDNLDLYSWSDADGYPYNDFLGGWPGMALNELEGEDDWYYLDIPVTFTDSGYANFIINGTIEVYDDEEEEYVEEDVETDNILMDDSDDVYLHTLTNERFASMEDAEAFDPDANGEEENGDNGE